MTLLVLSHVCEEDSCVVLRVCHRVQLLFSTCALLPWRIQMAFRFQSPPRSVRLWPYWGPERVMLSSACWGWSTSQWRHGCARGPKAAGCREVRDVAQAGDCGCGCAWHLPSASRGQAWCWVPCMQHLLRFSQQGAVEQSRWIPACLGCKSILLSRLCSVVSNSLLPHGL